MHIYPCRRLTALWGNDAELGSIEELRIDVQTLPETVIKVGVIRKSYGLSGYKNSHAFTYKVCIK